MNQCEKFKSDFQEHLDGRLDSARAEALQRHVQACDRCRAEFRALERLHGALRAERLEQPRGDLAEAVMARLLPAAVEWRELGAVAAVLIAAVVVMGVLGGVWGTAYEYGTVAAETAKTELSGLAAELAGVRALADARAEVSLDSFAEVTREASAMLERPLDALAAVNTRLVLTLAGLSGLFMLLVNGYLLRPRLLGIPARRER